MSETTPVFLCTGMSANGDSSVIDILAAYQEAIPPVLHIDVTGTPSYELRGSHDGERWHAYLSSSTATEVDLIVGVRYWKITKTGGSGSITAAVGPVPDRNGRNILPRLVVGDVVPGA